MGLPLCGTLQKCGGLWVSHNCKLNPIDSIRQNIGNHHHHHHDPHPQLSICEGSNKHIFHIVEVFNTTSQIISFLQNTLPSRGKNVVPSGYLTVRHRKSQCYLNHLFLWAIYTMAMLNNQMVWPHFLHRLTHPAAQIHRCSTGFLGCRNSTGTRWRWGCSTPQNRTNSLEKCIF